MILRTRLAAPLLVLALVLGSAFAAPAVAYADTLSWNRVYWGPLDRPNGEAEPIPVGGALNGVSFAGPSGWAVGVQKEGSIPSGFILSTRNGGSTWSPDAVSTPVELNAVTAISATKVWAVGMGGAVFLWDGSAWTPKTVSGSWPANKNLYAVAFADSRLGWAVGDGGGIIRTTDGGDSWSVATLPSTGGSSLRALAAVNATSAIAVGGSGTTRLLTETGSFARPAPTGSHLYSITFADADHAFAVGSGATMVKTANGGATWSPVTLALPAGLTGVNVTIYAVAFSDPLNGVATGTYQTVWRTSDGGSTWALEPLGEDTSDVLELRGVAFAGSADAPVVVARVSALDFAVDGPKRKARVYLGAWSGRVVPPPVAPSNVTAVDGGAPRPRIAVAWTDNSSDEDGFVVQRANGSTADGAFSTVATLAQNASSWTDTAPDWRSTWYYRVRSFRGALASTWAVSLGFAVDAIAPTTTSDAQASYVNAATIHLTASDNAGGSGVAHTYYRLDGGQQTEGTVVTLSGYGAHRLEYWSTDVASNAESPHPSADFTISDTIPPTTVSDAVVSYDSEATIRLTASDNAGGSGVAHTYYRLDNGPQTEGTTIHVVAAGTHDIEFWSVDVAGNPETPKSARFSVATPPVPDTTAPTTTSDAQASYVSVATIHLTADDAGGSGVAHTYYRLDNGQQTEGTTIQVRAAGAHDIEFWSIDVAGNPETPHTASFTVVLPPLDTTAPTTTSDAQASYVGAATIHLTALDNVGGSGVAHTYYRLDSGLQTEGTVVTLSSVGTHGLEYWSTDVTGNAENPHHTVTFTVVSKLATVVSIKRNVSSTSRGHTVTLSGGLRYGVAGDHVRLYYRKSGHTWSYRTITLSSYKWSSKYKFSSSRSARGKYYFFAAFAEDATRLSAKSGQVSVTVR